MRNHLLIALLLLFAVSLSACNKAEMPTETSSVLPTQKTEIIEKTSTQITTSEPATREESTTQFVISTEEKEENNSGNCNIKLSIFSVRNNLCYVTKPDFDVVAAEFKPLSAAALA